MTAAVFPWPHTNPETQEPKLVCGHPPGPTVKARLSYTHALDVEASNQEDRPGAGARPRVGRSAEGVSRAELWPLGYGVRGCWRVPIAASGRLARSHLALHIELHLSSGDGRQRGWGLVGRVTEPSTAVYTGNMWGMEGGRGGGGWDGRFLGNLGYYPSFMHVPRSPVWGSSDSSLPFTATSSRLWGCSPC